MKTINENGTFRKRCFHVYVWTDENVGFRIRWCNTSFTTIITHTLWGMLSYFHCSAFSHGRAKTIRIRYVWTRFFGKRREKKSSFSNKNVYVWTWPKFTWERERQGDRFYHLCQNAGAVPSLQLQPKFPPVNWAPWKIAKKSEIMRSLFFQRHFRGRRCCRIV